MSSQSARERRSSQWPRNLDQLGLVAARQAHSITLSGSCSVSLEFGENHFTCLAPRHIENANAINNTSTAK
jgi:hypothetical protein